MYLTEKVIVQWYVVFTDTNYSHWVLKRLDPAFRHVMAMKQSPGGAYWVLVDPGQSHIDISHHLCIDYLTPRDLVGEDAVILPVESHITRERANFGLFTCVSVVKGLLGIDRPLIQTPRQLYQHLVGSGT